MAKRKRKLEKASNFAKKHLDRITHNRILPGGSIMAFLFRDQSQVKVTMNVYDPKVEIVGPERSFARLLENDLVEVKVTFDNITFFCRDGSKFDMEFGDIPREVDL